VLSSSTAAADVPAGAAPSAASDAAPVSAGGTTPTTSNDVGQIAPGTAVEQPTGIALTPTGGTAAGPSISGDAAAAPITPLAGAPAPPETAASAAKTSRAGRAPAAYADAAGLSPRAAGPLRDRLSARGIVPDPTNAAASSAETVATSGRAADRARSGANVQGPVADSNAALAAALLAGRAPDGTSPDQAEQETERFADPQPRPNDVATQALHVLEGAVAAGLPHAGHVALAPGQFAGESGSTDRTTLASAVQSMSGVLDRSVGLDDGSLHRQMVKGIQLQSQNGIGDARLTLRPEYLGEVSIALRVEDGGVTAHVSASAADVREWLGANEALLRQGLLDQGLKLERLIVTQEPAEPRRDTRDSQARQQQSQPNEGDKPRPRRRDDVGTFEITV